MIAIQFWKTNAHIISLRIVLKVNSHEDFNSSFAPYLTIGGYLWLDVLAFFLVVISFFTVIWSDFVWLEQICWLISLSHPCQYKNIIWFLLSGSVELEPMNDKAKCLKTRMYLYAWSTLTQPCPNLLKIYFVSLLHFPTRLFSCTTQPVFSTCMNICSVRWIVEN